MRTMFMSWAVMLLLGSLTGCAAYGDGPGDGEIGRDADGGGDQGADLLDGGADAAADVSGDAGNRDCPVYVAALADCPYQLFISTADPDACTQFRCLAQRCTSDADCPLGGALETGSICAAGNCVFCSNDSQCAADRVCRAGWCVTPETDYCPSPGSCSQSRCSLVDPSEVPCPLCTCDSMFSHQCTADTDCLVISHYPYRRCLYGRCGDCLSDDDCQWGQCLPPGLCNLMEPNPEVLYGTWLLGIAAGMDHFSYFRFEPDGTLRRGRYEMSGTWSDDIPTLPCWPEEAITSPLLGSWEPEITNSGFLFIRMSLNISCDSGEGWSARFRVELSDDDSQAWFRGVDGDYDLQAIRMPSDLCSDDFSVCELPDIY